MERQNANMAIALARLEAAAAAQNAPPENEN